MQSAVGLEVPLRLFTVEIRMVGNLQLVTAVEILSPVNKRPGHEAYRGGYGSLIDYQQQPDLSEAEMAWLRQHLRQVSE